LNAAVAPAIAVIGSIILIALPEVMIVRTPSRYTNQ
jgi:hypothetical protein